MTLCNRAGCKGRRIHAEQLDRATARALDLQAAAIERRAEARALDMMAGRVSLDMIRASAGAGPALVFLGVPVTPEQMELFLRTMTLRAPVEPPTNNPEGEPFEVLFR